MSNNDYLIDIALERLKTSELYPLFLYYSGDNLREVQKDTSPISIKGCFLEKKEKFFGVLEKPLYNFCSPISNKIQLQVYEVGTIFENYFKGKYSAFEVLFNKPLYESRDFNALRVTLTSCYPLPCEKLLKNLKKEIKKISQYPIFFTDNYMDILQKLSYSYNLFESNIHKFTIDDEFLINDIITFHADDKEIDNDYSIKMNNDLFDLLNIVEESFYANKDNIDIMNYGDYVAINDNLVDFRESLYLEF